MSKTRSTAVVVATALAAAMLAGGCSFQDAICRGGEYPVKAVGNGTGGACVADNQDPPAGYVRYPAGKVPKHVDDKWDKYWRGKIVDAHGNIVG